jgi:hypothetical protein
MKKYSDVIDDALLAVETICKHCDLSKIPNYCDYTCAVGSCVAILTREHKICSVNKMGECKNVCKRGTTSNGTKSATPVGWNYDSTTKVNK